MSERARSIQCVVLRAYAASQWAEFISTLTHSLIHLLTLVLLLFWSLTPFDLNFSSSRVKTCVALNIRAQQSQLSVSLSERHFDDTLLTY